jgi:hypothetical protein
MNKNRTEAFLRIRGFPATPARTVETDSGRPVTLQLPRLYRPSDLRSSQAGLRSSHFPVRLRNPWEITPDSPIVSMRTAPHDRHILEL